MPISCETIEEESPLSSESMWEDDGKKRKRSLSTGNLNQIHPKGERRLSDFNGRSTDKRKGSMGSERNGERRLSLTARASQLIVQIPVEHLRRIRKEEGKSWDREAEHFCGITTMHGPLRAYRGKTPYRHLWAVMMVCSLSLLSFQIYTIVNKYMQKPVVSQVTFVTSDEGLRFPFVTMCNYNPIRTDYINMLNRSGLFTESVFQYLVQANAELQAFYGTAKEVDLERGHIDYIKFKNNFNVNYNVNDFFENGGYRCEDMFKLCSFAGQKFDCCVFAKPTMTSLGRCYTIDLSHHKWFHKQIAAGEYNGLQLILDSKLDQIYSGKGNESDPVFTNSFENGFRLYVHDREMVSFITTEGISVSPGSRVYSSLETERFQRLPRTDWGICSEEWPPEYKTKIPYSRKNCRAVCRAAYYNTKCGCSPYVYNTRRLFDTCSPRRLYECLHNTINFTTQAENREADIICSECPIECSNWEYHAYNSYGFGFSKGAQKWLKERNKQWTIKHISENFVMVSVFYRDLAFSLFSEEPGTSLSSVLSDIGGNMGLCFGMSVITTVEIIIFIYKMSWISFSSQRRKYMLEKRKMEEEKERNLEETVEEYARQKARKIDDEGKGVHRLKKISQRILDSMDKRRDRIHDVDMEHPAKKLSKQQRYMDTFYEEILKGGGRANLRGSRQLSDEDLIELKINLQDNGQDREIVGVVGERKTTLSHTPSSLPLGFQSKTVHFGVESENECDEREINGNGVTQRKHGVLDAEKKEEREKDDRNKKQ